MTDQANTTATKRAESYSNDQIRVLQHAADILGVSLDQLVGITASSPQTQPISGNVLDQDVGTDRLPSINKGLDAPSQVDNISEGPEFTGRSDDPYHLPTLLEGDIADTHATQNDHSRQPTTAAATSDEISTMFDPTTFAFTERSTSFEFLPILDGDENLLDLDQDQDRSGLPDQGTSTTQHNASQNTTSYYAEDEFFQVLGMSQDTNVPSVPYSDHNNFDPPGWVAMPQLDLEPLPSDNPNMPYETLEHTDSTGTESFTYVNFPSRGNTPNFDSSDFDSSIPEGVPPDSFLERNQQDPASQISVQNDLQVTVAQPEHGQVSENASSSDLSAGIEPQLAESGLARRVARDSQPSHGRDRQASAQASNRISKPTKKNVKSRFKTLEERIQTADTRKLKACVRCHLQRVRCIPDPENPAGCCITCRDAVTNHMMLPCVRYKISDTRFTEDKRRPEVFWTERWKNMKMKEIDTWESTEVRTLILTQDVGSARDVLRSSGVRLKSPCAPFAIENMAETGQQIRSQLEGNIEDFIAVYVNNSEPILKETYLMARDLMQNARKEEERTLLRSVLCFWVAARRQSKPSRICGGDTSGFVAQEIDPERHDYGQIPVPPVISAQFTLMTAVAMFNPLQVEIRKNLEELLKNSQSRSDSWFTIYLAIFILLHNCALITGYYRKKARNLRLHIYARYAAIAILEELHVSANILLAYFHHCAAGGSLAFAKGWTSPSDIAMARLSDDQARFLQRTSAHVKDKAPVLQRIRDEDLFDNDFYFISQLFDLEWKVSPRTVMSAA